MNKKDRATELAQRSNTAPSPAKAIAIAEQILALDPRREDPYVTGAAAHAISQATGTRPLESATWCEDQIERIRRLRAIHNTAFVAAAEARAVVFLSARGTRANERLAGAERIERLLQEHDTLRIARELARAYSQAMELIGDADVATRVLNRLEEISTQHKDHLAVAEPVARALVNGTACLSDKGHSVSSWADIARRIHREAKSQRHRGPGEVEAYGVVASCLARALCNELKALLAEADATDPIPDAVRRLSSEIVRVCEDVPDGGEKRAILEYARRWSAR